MTPQPGVFSLGSRSHQMLEFALRGDASAPALAEAVAGLRETPATVGGVNVVVGFGGRTWTMLTGAEGPPAMTEIAGPGGVRFPSTQHDVWVWVHGAGPDVVLDAARSAAAAMAGLSTLALAQAGFVYRHSRDMTGFEDGTENPPLSEAAVAMAVPAGRPGAGGTLALTQRWVHDLEAFSRLDVSAQEAVIGRTRDHSEELSPLPESSHVARVVVEGDDGEELEVFRRSVPFGEVTEQGLYFVAFTPELGRVERMLRRMAGAGQGDDAGPADALTGFSSPLTGSYWLVPSVEDLARLGG
ncbi:MAG TPA: Dyp-type peroxidase [Acidimicrobiales bacterium]|nr:Dyp-type peroxidase [Acidimicrobiales bacterium]